MRSSNHSRSQSSQRCPDLGTVFDAHVRHEFEDKDLNATMGTMVDEPYVHHVPTMTGGVGRRGVYNFYKDHFIGRTPGDAKLIRVSRTVDEDQVVDELVLSFTHDREIDFLLPSVAPTGRHVEIPLVVVMRFRDGKVSHEHIYWDQATVLGQIGLLPSNQEREGLPITGAEQARKLLELSGHARVGTRAEARTAGAHVLPKARK